MTSEFVNEATVSTDVYIYICGAALKGRNFVTS